jgi:thiosulfate/3-mercaptopyruvate sulfurtransferase
VGADGKFLGRHLPGRAALIETLRGWGISDDTQVVAYDAHGGMFAARWWLLRWVGHPAVAVLDGGLAWQSAGQSMTTQTAGRPAGSISDKPSLVATVSVDEVLANLETRRAPWSTPAPTTAIAARTKPSTRWAAISRAPKTASSRTT